MTDARPELEQALARELVERFPTEAAVELEASPDDQAVSMVRMPPPDIAAAVLDGMTPVGSARLLAQLPVEIAGGLVEALDPARAAALVTASAVLLWSRSLGLTMVIGVSMILSMAAAGLAGAAIPMILTVLKQDPAQSSSIVLTTVTDTQPLGRMIFEMQRARVKSAMVLDDRGTVVGGAFMEDALEEIVGTIHDEFDGEVEGQPAGGAKEEVMEVRGDMALPEAVEMLGLEEPGEDDTIGGHVVAQLGRLPREGDVLTLGEYQVTVTEVARMRALRLRFERQADPTEE